MRIPAVIMAGGKGTRFDFNALKLKNGEKLLLQLGKKTIIEHVIDAASKSKYINRVILAYSKYTLQTKNIIETKYNDVVLFKTPGKGYHFDLSSIIKALDLGLLITIVGDIPLIKTEIIDDIIETFFKLNKPSVAVMTDISNFNKVGLSPTYPFQSEDGNKKIITLGINIFDGSLINQEEELEQAIILSDKVELLYNINKINDYYQLRNYFNELKKKK